MASNYYVAYQCIQVIMLIANFALAVYAFVWYFVKQILKLKNANYHIFMFTILMTALMGENVGIILNIVARAQAEQETVLSEQTIRIYRATFVNWKTFAAGLPLWPQVEKSRSTIYLPNC